MCVIVYVLDDLHLIGLLRPPQGGIRVPGIMHAPGLIKSHINVTTPTFTGDFLPVRFLVDAV